MKINRYQEAYDEFREALNVDPNHAEAHHNLAVILYLAKRYDDAMKHLVAAKEQNANVNPQFEKALNDKLNGK